MRRLDKDANEQIKARLTKIIMENELIIKAQQGDISAENVVLKEYAPLVKSIARAYSIIGEDGDDIIQMGMIGLMSAVRTYDAEGAATFKTYASTCIRNSILDVVRKSSSRVSFDVDIDDVEIFSDEHEPERMFIEDETSRLLTRAITSVLNDKELSVLRLYLDAMSYSEISEKLGIERKKVDNTLYSMKKKIKKLLSAKNKH